MEVKIIPKKLEGTVKAPDSKSHAHRLLIAEALASGWCMADDTKGSRVLISDISEDIKATSRCLTELMAAPYPHLQCGESGSTLRFLLPLSVCIGRGAVFLGKGKLPSRPLSPLDKEMERHGAVVSALGPKDTDPKGYGPSCSDGGSVICHTYLKEGMREMSGGNYELPGNVSSQFVTGLLFALPLIEEDSRIVLTSRLESKPYVDITLRVLESYGIEVAVSGEDDMPVYEIKGGQKYTSPSEPLSPEGDWSGAAFWLAANALGSDIEVTGLSDSSAQGDKKIRTIIEMFKAKKNERVIDASNVPDLVPVISVLAALTPGRTKITNAARLRIKESDRLATTAAMLTALGADVSENADGLSITGKERLSGGRCDGAGDHRIVMAAAIAATGADRPVTISGAEAAAKSYPSFFERYKELGGNITLTEK